MLIPILGFAILFVLLFIGLPIGWGMMIVGTVGFAMLVDWQPALSMAAQITYDTAANYSLTVLPLFILMGNLINMAGLSRDLYNAADAFVGHRRGGLAMATIVACGGFSALCGSSMATAAAMSRVSLPSMRRFGYDDSLAAGSIASGGTLGILIPPSVILVIYGILTNTDIGKLFAAGILPGLLGICLYVLAVGVVTARRPHLGPPGARKTTREKMQAVRNVGLLALLFAVIMGGIYGGVFTPTEAAGIGAAGALLLALKRRGLNWPLYWAVLVESTRTTAMMFALVIGALIFNNFITVAGLPDYLIEIIDHAQLSPLGVIVLICAIYLVLGCVLESMSMVLLTVPVFNPLVQSLGFDLIWFGIIVVVVTEISLITPPIGLNIFVVKAMIPDVKVSSIIRGVMPFIAADIVRLALLVLIPSIVMLIPASM